MMFSPSRPFLRNPATHEAIVHTEDVRGQVSVAYVLPKPKGTIYDGSPC
jgi:hypothetical protein